MIRSETKTATQATTAVSGRFALKSPSTKAAAKPMMALKILPVEKKTAGTVIAVRQAKGT